MTMLDGVRVVDLGSFITAPYAAMQLAELGADVVKVERPQGGDPFRSFAGGLYSPQYQAHNRGKRSLALDYASPQGLSVLKALAANADVLIVNLRPGAAERLGLGAAALQASNPRLIYCAISGFGESGPYRDRPAYDTVGQALSGWLSLFHDSADPRIAGPAVCDAITGLFAAQGVLAALYERERTGRGRLVEANMVEACLAFATEPLSQFFASGKAVSPFSRTALSQSFVLMCADGRRIGLHLSSPDKFWRGLLLAIERPDLGEDERFARRESRVRHYEDLARALAEAFARRPAAEWERRLLAHDVPFSPALRLDELEDDPHVRHLDPFVRAPHPRQGEVRGVRHPLRYDRQRLPDLPAPPELGEHSLQLLRQIGLSDGEIDAMVKAGIVAGA
ncbi:CaiB/BaiF CoA transferase family protein [Aquabacterium sp. J223]|uniref:CaiB/BaiF CoA transferase family protein n=1 Tax=Aquabacterium sp. J223 TaxID=2898431 RepID=UPI0021ADB94A|nr:CaiB/BaiF CoA-transferase family protein [Aquabacterium sp. J223]UUX95294.1 CoA transferase [Aquabacterium sp. J223]